MGLKPMTLVFLLSLTLKNDNDRFEQTLKILLFVNKNYIAVQYIPSVKCRKRSE